MKKILLIFVILGGIVSYLGCKNGPTRSDMSAVAYKKDTARFFRFRSNIDKANNFLDLVSGHKYRLDDTLWIERSLDRPVGIWAKQFFGTSRPAIYEVGISNYNGIDKIVLPDHPDSSELVLQYKSDGIVQNADEFYYSFKGLLLTFCEQQHYKLPTSDF